MPQLTLNTIGGLIQGALLCLDDMGIILHANRKASECLLGCTEELVGRNLRSLLPEDQAPKIDDIISKGLRTRSPMPASFEVIDTNGQRIRMQCNCARMSRTERHILLHLKIRDDNQFLALNRQIEELGAEIARRRALERALFESKERLELILESTPEGIFGVDLNGCFTFCNASGLQALHYQRATDLVGREVDPLLFQNGYVGSLDLAHNAQASTEVSTNPRRSHFSRSDKSAIPVEYRVRPVLREGAVIGTVVTFSDITKRLLSEERSKQFSLKVQQGQKLESLGVLAGGIAHDFNNLLLGIIGNTELALYEVSQIPNAQEYLGDAIECAQKAAELCNQMLAYSGKGRFVVVPLDMSELVENMAQLLKVSISKNVELRYDFKQGLPAIEADATQLRQIVMNLIINGSDAIGESAGFVGITTGEMYCDSEYLSETYLNDDLAPGNYVFLEVSDSGSGISPEAVARIFEPFYSTKETGRGLGLAAVLGIVRGHSGALKIDSEPGTGTTMKVLFPCSDLAPSLEQSNTPELPRWKASGTVMVVDDEENIRVLASRIFAMSGIDVLLACDGEEAVRIYQERGSEIRAVLLDMTMPKLNGEQTFKELQKIDPTVVVVLSSGYNEQDAVSRFTGKGLAGFIQKPYRPQQLLEIFRECMDT